MASIAMFGNTAQPVEVMVRSSHLFMPMPDVIREDTGEAVGLLIPTRLVSTW
jgi:predicted ATP-dependent Lon-type protease